MTDPEEKKNTVVAPAEESKVDAAPADPADDDESSPEFDKLSKELEEMDVEAEADKGYLAFDEEKTKPKKDGEGDAAPKDDGASDDKSGDETPPPDDVGKDVADDNNAGDEEGGETKVEMDPNGKFSKELVAQAEELGFSAKDLKDIGTPERLQEVVDQFVDQIAQAGQAAVVDPSVQAQVLPEDDVEKKSPVKKDNEKDEPGAPEGDADANFLLEGLDDFEPEFVEAVNGALGKIQKGFDDRIARIEKAAFSQEEAQFQRERVEFEQKFDVFVEKLGKGFHDVVGQGTSREVSKAMNQGRQKILQQALVMELGYQELKMPVPEFDALFNQAARSIFGNKFETNAKRDLAEKAKVRARGAVNRAGNRVTIAEDPKDEYQDAREWGESFLASKGVRA